MQPQVELPSITAHKSGAFSVTSTPLEEVPTAGQVDDCILAEHYTPCGALRATAPHAASQLHVHKLSSMLVMVKTVRLGELQTARQRHRAVTEWRLLRALRHKHIARLVHVMRDTDTDYVGASLSAIAETLLLVHEYCAGGSLEAYVTRYGALQVPPPPSPPLPSPPPSHHHLLRSPHLDHHHHRHHHHRHPHRRHHFRPAGAERGAHRWPAQRSARPLPRAAG